MSAIDELKNAPRAVGSDDTDPLLRQYREALLKNERNQVGVNSRLLDALQKTPRDFGKDLDTLRQYRALLEKKRAFELNRRSLEDGRRQLAAANTTGKRVAAELLIRTCEKRAVGEDACDNQIAKLVSQHDFLRGWRLPR